MLMPFEQLRSGSETSRSLQRRVVRVALMAALVFGGTRVAHAAYRCPQAPSPAPTETYQGFLGRVQELNGQELPYRLFVPKNYDANKPYPLVLYLHHAGLAGTDSNNQSGWDNCVHLTSEIGSGDDYGGVFTHRAVDKGGQRFDTQERYPHFVLAPHAQSPAYGFGGGVAGSASGKEHPTRALLWAMLDAVQGEFNIDPARLYVTGISMGCYGTWDLIMRSPGVFAAASPQSCRGDPDTKLLAPLKDMPIWSMCGTKDSYFSGAQAMADGMKQVGATSSTFTFTAMEGVGHSINDRGYDYPGFIDWMFAQRLAGAPIGGGGGAGAGAAGSGGASDGAGAGGAGGGGTAGHSEGGVALAGGGNASRGGTSSGDGSGASGSGPVPPGGGSSGSPRLESRTSSSSCALGDPQRAPGGAAIWGLALILTGWRRAGGRARSA
jgi:poly(3-hydroxybutyrate) depolymerase